MKKMYLSTVNSCFPSLPADTKRGNPEHSPQESNKICAHLQLWKVTNSLGDIGNKTRWVFPQFAFFPPEKEPKEWTAFSFLARLLRFWVCISGCCFCVFSFLVVTSHLSPWLREMESALCLQSRLKSVLDLVTDGGSVADIKQIYEWRRKTQRE